MKIFVIILSFFIWNCNAQKTVSKEYVFFLHNKFLEDNELGAKHPKFGVVEYTSILEKFKANNTILISEKRKKNTDPEQYAKQIVSQIDSLHKNGIPYDKISIVGTSKGGYIAQYVSYFAKNPKLKFIIIGASFKNDSMNKDKNFKLYGKILSINEESDTNSELLSKQKRFKNSKIKYFKEINLHTGLNHGFLFQSLKDWIEPTKKWINNNFN